MSCKTELSLINHLVLSCRNNAKYAFQFSLLRMTPHNRQKRRRKESLILRLPQHQKCHVLYSFGSFQRSLEHPQTLFFGSVWKSSEVTGMFSEIPIMTGQKSHAFDSEKVGSHELELAMVS